MTLRCGIGKSSKENHTFISRGTSSLLKILNHSKTSQPAYSSELCHKMGDMQLIRNTVLEV